MRVLIVDSLRLIAFTVAQLAKSGLRRPSTSAGCRRRLLEKVGSHTHRSAMASNSLEEELASLVPLGALR